MWDIVRLYCEAIQDELDNVQLCATLQICTVQLYMTQCRLALSSYL